MKKSTRIVKRLLALFLVVLMSIESFGALVSDNDGSAFITKGEFDSLKSSFQSQIDNYNTSIDSKIDGAIAAYLAGVTVEKKRNVDIIVTNYKDIQWIPNIKIYGTYKKWTSNTNKTEITTKQWFTPNANEKRHNVRGMGIEIVDVLDTLTGIITGYFAGNYQTLSGGLAEGRSAYVSSSSYAQTCPVMFLFMEKATDGQYYISQNNPWRNDMVEYATMISERHFYSKLSGDMDNWMFNAYNRAVWTGTWNGHTVVEDLDDGQIFKYKTWLYSFPNNTSDNYAGIRSVLDTSNTAWPVHYSDIPALHWDAGYAISSSALFAASVGCASDYFSRGCTWTLMDSESATAQYNLLTKGMIGTDYSQDVNVGYYIKTHGEARQFDFTESTDSGEAVGKLIKMNFMNAKKSRNGVADYEYRDITNDFSIGYPHWPTANIRNLSSNNFKNGTTPLKMGDGIIILNSSESKGYLRLTMDYKVHYLLNSNTNNKITYSIKKTNFNDSTTTNNYYSGYNNHVDPNTTTDSAIEFKNKAFESTDGKLKITIPVEKGDSVWMRIAPQNETGGYYAKMDSLKLELYTEQ